MANLIFLHAIVTDSRDAPALELLKLKKGVVQRVPAVLNLDMLFAHAPLAQRDD
jgi:hypothetical protein